MIKFDEELNKGFIDLNEINIMFAIKDNQMIIGDTIMTEDILQEYYIEFSDQLELEETSLSITTDDVTVAVEICREDFNKQVLEMLNKLETLKIK